MTVLGLDLGSKRIGVAKSDELRLLAHPLELISRTSDQATLDKIDQLVVANSVTQVVVGLPITLKGELGTQAKSTLSFVELLKRKLTCDVLTWDERLTTAQAEKRLLAHDVSRKKRREKRDGIAAEIMLQGYLDFLQMSGKVSND